MREYARKGDHELRRACENISAAMLALQSSDPSAFARLEELLATASEVPLTGITFEQTAFEDVMFGLREEGDSSQAGTPARVLSDGLLRLAAIATAVLSEKTSEGRSVLIIEELENALHPSLARDVLGFLRAEADARSLTLVITTHSASLMDALTSEDHESVVLVRRDARTRRTRLVPLTDAPGYVRATLKGGLGAMLESGSIPQTASEPAKAPLSSVWRRCPQYSATSLGHDHFSTSRLHRHGIMCEFLGIPNHSSTSMCAQVRGVLAEPPAGVTFVLPLTSVIEVGNHIAQITDGTVRRTLAQRWQAILQATLDEQAPWNLHTFEWTSACLSIARTWRAWLTWQFRVWVWATH